MSIPASTTDDPTPLAPGARFGLLRRRQFALLYAGQGVSLLGDRLVMVAQPFAVLSLPGAGAGDVGLVLGANALGFAVFVLVGGVVADRLPRQRTMLASDLARCVVQGLAAYLLLTGNATVGSLALLQLLYGAAEAFFRPAVLGLVPQVVEPGEEQGANALLALNDNVAMVAGPVTAGILVAWLGPGITLAVDAATFVVSALTLLLLRPRRVAPAPSEGFRHEVAGGWREVRSRTWVWTTLLAFSAYHALVLPAVFVLGPKVAEDFRDGATSWGIISTGFGVGAVVGSVVALRWRPRHPGTVVAACMVVASCQGAICSAPLPTLVVAGLEAVTGVAVALTFTVWETAVQTQVPPQAHSRVSSFDHLASVTLMPVGFAVMGPVADALGVRATSVGASAVTIAICLVLLPGMRLLRPGR